MSVVRATSTTTDRRRADLKQHVPGGLAADQNASAAVSRLSGQNVRVSDVPRSLRVHLLGGLVVEGLSDVELGSRKARTLVKVLSLARGAPVSVSLLAEVLWTHDPPSRPSDQISVLVSRLRQVLGADRVVRSEAGFALRVDWLDVDELAVLVGEASAALGEGRRAAARAAAGAALTLARGAVLPEDDGDWLEVDRARAAATVKRARGLAATAALLAGDVVGAELAAESALADDPYDEVALRTLMQAHVAGGRSASALAVYARMRERLAEDLGVSPDAETEAIHTAVLLGGDQLRAASVPTRTRLISRERELDALDGHLAAAGRDVRVVMVIGEAGIGKTALVSHFAERVRGAGTRVVLARPDELGRDLPLQPILDALRVDGEATAGAVADQKSAMMMPDTGERVRRFTAVLAELVGSSSPTVLVIDDLHWADSTTRAWLTWVQHRPGALLVLAVARPGTTVTGAHELLLGPLDGDAIGALIGEDGDAPRVAAVRARSGGNPLFALALMEAPEGELPASVQKAVASTLARLDSAAADVVRAGAVFGATVDIDLLAGVLRLPAIEVIEGLERAVAVGLLVESGSGFEFRHPLVREALGAMVGAARTAFFHREAARLLDSRPNRDLLAIAVHARLGGATELAAQAFHAAAAVSLSRSDLAAAEEQLRASLHAVDTADAHRALARVLMVAGRLDQAADEAERAVALGGGPEALEVAGWVDYYRRRYGPAQRFADEAVERAAPGSPIRTSALALGGRIRHGTGDTRGAQERLTGALDGPPGLSGVAEVWLGQLRVHEGRPGEALELIEHALIDPAHLAHPFAPLHGRFTRVMALGQLGRVEEALRASEDLRLAIQRAGAVGVRFAATELNARAWLLRGSGRLKEADELNRSAIESNGAPDGSGPSSDGFAEAYWVAWLDLADGQLAQGDPSGAASVLHQIAPIDTWQGTMAWHQRHRLGLLRARVARASGSDHVAVQLASDVMDDATRRGTTRYAALGHVQVALAGGDSDLDRIAESVDTLRRCAALELPGLLDELGQRFDVERWQAEARERSRTLSSAR
jgi:DNA-binding SARP family transcriptional activator/tetratricopeptide (TPR) repeat protein